MEQLYGEVDTCISELYCSDALQGQFGMLSTENPDVIINWDIYRLQRFWIDFAGYKNPVLEIFIDRLSSIRRESVISKMLLSIDWCVEKEYFNPLDIANRLLSEKLRVDNPEYFKCAYKFIIKLAFYIDYKGNRQLFNKLIEKSGQFPPPVCGSYVSRTIWPAIDFFQILLCREINLLPAYLVMYELKTAFPREGNSRPPPCIQNDVEKFMDSFAPATRLIYSYFKQSMVPIAGITLATSPGFQLNIDTLAFVSLKNAKLYPANMNTRQLPLLCSVLGQLRCRSVVIGILESITASTPQQRMISRGLEAALPTLIVELMEITEKQERLDWVLSTFEHLTDVVVQFVSDCNIHLSQVLIDLNSKLADRRWPKSRDYVMWLALNITSGFIKKNKLTDFVPCLRLFDILYPEAEDLQLADSCADESSRAKRPRLADSPSSAGDGDGNNGDVKGIEEEEGSDEEADNNEICWPDEAFSSEESEESDDEFAFFNAQLAGELEEEEEEECEDALAQSQPPRRCRRRRQRRARRRHTAHLRAAPACQWLQVMQNSRLHRSHLPRSMPPALSPLESQLSKYFSYLTNPSASAPPPDIGPLTWSKLLVTLNAYSADERCDELIGILVKNFWPDAPPAATAGTNVAGQPANVQLQKFAGLFENALIRLPYGVVASGPVKPLPNHLVRMMSMYLRFVIFVTLLELINLKSGQIATPASLETFCRLFSAHGILTHRAQPYFSLRPLIEKKCFALPLYRSALQTSMGVAPAATTTEPAAAGGGGDGGGGLAEQNQQQQVHPEPPEDAVNSLVSAVTLLDMIGHRLTKDPLIYLGNILRLPHYRRQFFAKSQQQQQQQMGAEGSAGGEELTTSASDGELPQELAYMLDWTALKMSRNLLVPDCILYDLFEQVNLAEEIPSISQTALGSRPPISENSSVLPIFTGREEMNRVVLLSLVQAILAYDLIEVNGIRRILELQLGVSRQSPRLLDLRLPPIIYRRLWALDFRPFASATASAESGGSFFAGPMAADQAFAGSDFTRASSDSVINTSQLVNTALEEYRSRISQGEFMWSLVNKDSPHFLCTVLLALTDNHPVPLRILNAVIASPVSTVCQQVKVLADFLVEIIRLCVQSEEAGTAKPAPPYTPSAVLQGLLTFCIKYRVVPLDRILLSLLLRSSQTPVEIAAVHSVFFFIFSQCSELRAAIKKIYEVGSARSSPSNSADVPTGKRHSLPCPSLISSSRWQDLLNYLHSIIPEQSVQLPGMDEPEVRQPRMPVYFDHLLLRLLPILEIFFTSCLDNPPPLLQLARFCNIVSPLMLLHHRPVNLSFILLRGQLQQFGSPAPTITPTLPKVFSFRKSNLIEKVCCQLIIRSLLHEHQQLAVCTNRALRRDCAMRFADLGVSGLFSPPAWNHLQSVFECALAKAEAAATSPAAAVTYSDADFASCLRTTAQVTEQELLLAKEIDRSAGSWHPTAEYMIALLSPIVASATKHGISSVPAAWRPWRLEENVSVQAAGVYSVACEIMVLMVPETVHTFTECLRLHSNDADFGNWLNVAGILVSVLPPVFRSSILESVCKLFTNNEPCLADTTLYPHDLVTLVSGVFQHPSEGGLAARNLLLHGFRAARFAGLPDLTFFRADPFLSPMPPSSLSMPGHRVSTDSAVIRLDPLPSYLESLGRPHAAAVEFFDRILPLELPPGNTSMPLHIFKASLWHAIWSHANSTQLMTLPSVFSNYIFEHLDNEARLLMAFFLIAPVLGTLNLGCQTQVHQVTEMLYKALTKVDQKLAAAGVPLYHVNTLADVFYHIKYMYVGNSVQEKVRPLLSLLRPRLHGALKFILPPLPSGLSEHPFNPVQEQQQQSGTPAQPVFEGRVYRAATTPPIGLEDF